jgi:hypothetical protein
MIPPKFNFNELDMPQITTHGQKWPPSTLIPLIIGFQWDRNVSCHYIHFFTTLRTNMNVPSTLIPPLLDFIKIPLDLAIPFNFFMYSHAYIFRTCSNLSGFFGYINIASFLIMYYLWKNHLPHSCIYIWDEWNIPLIWPTPFTCICIVMEHTCSFTFIHLHTCSKYGSPCT